MPPWRIGWEGSQDKEGSAGSTTNTLGGGREGGGAPPATSEGYVVGTALAGAVVEAGGVIGSAHGGNSNWSIPHCCQDHPPFGGEQHSKVSLMSSTDWANTNGVLRTLIVQGLVRNNSEGGGAGGGGFLGAGGTNSQPRPLVSPIPGGGVVRPGLRSRSVPTICPWYLPLGPS
jgi:hypothetical protein